MKIRCNACGHGLEVPAGSVEVKCPECSARITLTAMETRASPDATAQPFGDQAPEALVGTELGGYRLTAILGGGGMGCVYEAERVRPDSQAQRAATNGSGDARPGPDSQAKRAATNGSGDGGSARPGPDSQAKRAATNGSGDGWSGSARPGPKVVAVKVLSPAFALDPEFVERFRREADALIALRHENLIEVYAKGEYENPTSGAINYFFIMERFFGEDLRSLMSRGPVSPKTAVAIVRCAAAALSYAHEKGIVHRDVKPANILVRGDPAEEGEVKVVDFGVAQLAGPSYALTSLTHSNLILGTINYMSPEQRIDASGIDYRSDIYALGVVAYELLTGRLPIGAFELPSELGALNRATDRAVMSALRRDPDHRPKTVLAFAELLESAIAKRTGRGFWLGAAAAVLLLAGAVGVSQVMGIFGSKPRDPVEPIKALEPAAVPKGESQQVAFDQQGEGFQEISPNNMDAWEPSEPLQSLAERMKRNTAYALEVAQPVTRPVKQAETTKRPKKKRRTRKSRAKPKTQKKVRQVMPAEDAPTDAAEEEAQLPEPPNLDKMMKSIQVPQPSNKSSSNLSNQPALNLE